MHSARKSHFRQAISCLFLMALGLAGCGTGNEPVVQEESAWTYTDAEIFGIPEDAYICAITSQGIYYKLEMSIDYSKEEPTTENEFHFLDHSGHDRILLRKSDMNTYSIKDDGNNMILCIATNSGMEIIKLSPEGNTETLFNQNAPQFPFIQTCGQYMVSIRNNFVEDSDMYENVLILRDNDKQKETVIYRALRSTEKSAGEDLGCVSMNNESVCFTLNKYYEDKESEHILFLYDISKEEIVDEISLPTRVYYAAYGGDESGLLLSETDDYTYMEEAGSLGYIKNNAYVETAKIPLISASNMIRNGVYTGNGYYFTTYDAAYYWDTQKNRIYVFDYQWIKNRKFGISLSEDGLKCVIRDGDHTFIRTIAIN